MSVSSYVSSAELKYADKETEGGVNLPMLLLWRLEVTQASSLHKPQLANAEKGSEERSTDVEKDPSTPAECLKSVTPCCVYGQG